VSPQTTPAARGDGPRARPLVTVVLPTCDRIASLAEALQSIIDQRSGGEFDQEVIVVGNASPPSVGRLVADMSLGSPVPIRYVFEPRVGVSHARNRGIDHASGDWVAFFDDDQVAHPEWLRELLRVADAATAPCVGGRITLRLSAGVPPLSPRCRNILGEQSFAGAAFLCTDRNIPSSGNLMVARHVFQTVGMFDVGMRNGGEDSELVRRMRRAGIPVVIAPSAVVQHVVPAHRTTAAYLRFVSLRMGAAFAYTDLKEHGRGGMAMRCFARTGQTLLMTLPAAAAAAMRRDHGAVLDAKILLWRYRGYARKTFSRERPDFRAPADPWTLAPAATAQKES
jgi:GT2 family glycosyltransferase